MDIDRLHEVLNGNKVDPGSGRTFAMLVLAIQNADFSETSVVILTAGFKDGERLINEFCRIAFEMGYRFEVSGYKTRTIELGDDEVLIFGDYPNPTIYKFMPYHLPDKEWLRAQGDAVGLAVWDHRAKEVKALLFKIGKIGQNERCPCGSGVKYKFCHGRMMRK